MMTGMYKKNNDDQYKGELSTGKLSYKDTVFPVQKFHRSLFHIVFHKRMPLLITCHVVCHHFILLEMLEAAPSSSSPRRW
jgi:hypothetical protein